MLPKRIGRYEVLGRLAAGGMAEILLARISGPADFKRAIVIKRILRAHADKESFVKMFLDEARVVASLRHPNVVHVQELGEHEGDPFLVMEYVAGENAASLLKRSVSSHEPFDPRLAAHVVAEACAGLHAAHELTDDSGRPQNLVHRDVSPQNVLIGYDGQVKLVDFGVVLVDRKSTVTEPGEVKGKFDYMSPEQMHGRALDRRSDVFSLGIVLYELSTGRRLFKRASHAKTIEAICREPVVPPSRVIADGYPAKLEAIVMRALAKDPTERYATAADMRRDLLEVVREVTSPTDALAERMRGLFGDRIAEKDEMLRHVSAGEEIAHVPAGETDEAVEVPNAPEETLVRGPRPPLVDVTRTLQLPTPYPAALPQPIAAPPPPALAAAPPSRATALAGAISALGALAVLGIVGAIALRRPAPAPTDASSPPPEPIVSVAAPATSDTPPPAPGPAAAAAATVVKVHVESKPPGARVLVAGRDRGQTPLDVKLPYGKKSVPVEIQRQGYVSIAQPVTPDADQKIIVALTRDRQAHKATSTSTSAPPPAPAPAPSPAPTPTSSFRRFD